MAVNYYGEPRLEKPELFAAWPGIGNIGLLAVDTLRGIVRAEQFAEIEAWDFLYPHSVTIKNGELISLDFPSCRFYSKRLGEKDLIFFIGEQQPTTEKKGYELANLVLDIALRFGCRRIYTCGAAVASVHHSMKPRVWAVPNRPDLLKEVKNYPNSILVSEIEGRDGQGNISGLNGLLLGLAKARGVDGISLLGEIPVYISQLPISYPKASKSILEVLAHHLQTTLDLSHIESLAQEVEESIEKFYEQIPPEIKQRIDQLKSPIFYEKQRAPITEEEKKRIVQELEEFFKKGGKD